MSSYWISQKSVNWLKSYCGAQTERQNNLISPTFLSEESRLNVKKLCILLYDTERTIVNQPNSPGGWLDAAVEHDLVRQCKTRQWELWPWQGKSGSYHSFNTSASIMSTSVISHKRVGGRGAYCSSEQLKEKLPGRTYFISFHETDQKSSQL